MAHLIARYCLALALVFVKLARAQVCYVIMLPLFSRFISSPSRELTLPKTQTDCLPILQYSLSSCMSSTVNCECLAFNKPDYISCLQRRCPASPSCKSTFHVYLSSACDLKSFILSEETINRLFKAGRESLELVCAAQGVTLVPIFSSSTTTRRRSTSTSPTATDDPNQTSTTPTPQAQVSISSTASHHSSNVATTMYPSSPDTSGTSSSAPTEPSKPVLSTEAIVSISVTIGGIILATVLAIPMIHYARRSHRGGEGRSNATAGTHSSELSPLGP